MHDREFDVVIVGAGLGGLQCAVTLAREGMSVCVLEMNQQLGGSLQVFSRNKTVFDTGVHYIGGLEPGQNLHRYFSYYGIMDKLKLRRMDMDAFDVVELQGDPEQYPHAQGWDNFVDRLAALFPGERGALERYARLVRDTCDRFPLYRLRDADEHEWMDDRLTLNAEQVIASLTPNTTLRAVLAGSNALYAGDHGSPFYMNALVVNTFVESAWRCVDGGSQIAKHLASNARSAGAVIHARKRVTGLDMDGNGVRAVRTADGDVFSCRWCIANIHPAMLLEMIPPGHIRPAYRTRIRSLDNTVSTFILHLAMKPGSFPYLNRNIYKFLVPDVWGAVDAADAAPSAYMFSTPATSRGGEHADAITMMTYMRYSACAPWAGTHRTVAEPGERGPAYEDFKHAHQERLLDVLEERFPGLRRGVTGVHSTTPLTFRDFIGTPDGNMYGIRKDSSSPLRTFLSPRTKVPNLLLTGQNLNLHGLLGVTVGSVSTCAELVGKSHLLGRIHAAN